jgi:hypothetical protein
MRAGALLRRKAPGWCRALAWLGALAAVLAAVPLPASAAAAAKGQGRIGVVAFKGIGEGAVRARVVKAVKAAGFQVVGGGQLEKTATGLGAMLESEEGLAAVAKELNVAAFVTGEITRKKASIAVHNGADGAVLAEAAFAGANPKKIQAAVAAGFWRELGPAIRQGRAPAGAKTRAVVAEEAEPADADADVAPAAAPPPPPPAPARAADDDAAAAAGRPPTAASKKTPAAAPAADAADAEDDGGDDDGGDEAAPPARRRSQRKAGGAPDDDGESPPPIALRFGVGGRALFRSLSVHDDPAHALSPYQLAPGPEGTAWLEVFPASFMTDGIAAQVGLFGSIDQGFGVTSKTKGGVQLTTKFQDFVGGLKVRIPLGAVAPYISGAYGQQTFRLQQDSGPTIVPGVAYKFIRAGAGVHITFTHALVADVDLGFLSVTDPGSQPGDIHSSDFFLRATAYAVEAGASVGLRVLGPLGLRAGGELRQYGLDFHSLPGDPMQVGGAVDRYLTVWGGVEVLLDGFD